MDFKLRSRGLVLGSGGVGRGGKGDGAVYGCGELLLGVRDDDERLVATWRDFVLRGAKWVLVGSRDMGRCLYYASAHVWPTKTILRLL